MQPFDVRRLWYYVQLKGYTKSSLLTTGAETRRMQPNAPDTLRTARFWSSPCPVIGPSKLSYFMYPLYEIIKISYSGCVRRQPLTGSAILTNPRGEFHPEATMVVDRIKHTRWPQSPLACFFLHAPYAPVGMQCHSPRFRKIIRESMEMVMDDGGDSYSREARVWGSSAASEVSGMPRLPDKVGRKNLVQGPPLRRP